MALDTWGNTETIYRDLDEVQPLLRSQINQAQALRTLGFYRRAKTTLERAEKELNDLPDSLLKAKALQSLGVTLRSIGDLSESEIVLNRSLNIATAKNLFPSIKSDIDSLPPSLRKIYAQINLADSIIKISTEKPYSTEIENILIAALKVPSDNYRAKSSVLGELGYFYEQKQRWTEASKLTQQAIILAKNSQATDIVANWYWQLGRILKARGKTDDAIAQYQQAIDTLQSLRQDLVAINPNIRFNYRDRVEPVYRQFVQLLLENVDSLQPEIKQEHLMSSREAIESLQLAELENYFREACVVYQQREIETIDPKAAVVYPILLEDRLEVILSLPNQPLQHYGNSLTSIQKEQIFRNINQTLNPVFLPDEILPPAQQLYDWLIRPGKASLEQQGIKTLVFVLDDLLRNIPMSVLHDGEQYLIEQYDLALTPGLQLLDSASNSAEIKTLTGGLTVARQGFPPLPRVKQELERISNLVP